ncbi:MAG: hydroxymethylbilane synthase [Flavobacteriales bacterium]
MTKPIIIGTRGSDLALWQANTVKDLLAEKGHEAELKIIHSTGDKDRKAKLHEMGLVGVFTKELDDALLLGEIDVAVHSLKDVPTSPPKGIVQRAVLERANPYDLLVSNENPTKKNPFTLASGSLRRRAFWMNKYPNHELQELRGNVPNRLAKISEGTTNGVILAKAGLDRLGLTPDKAKVLEWMTPAPAQGIVGVFCLESNARCNEALPQINHRNTEICAYVERDLLKTLEGGCTAPIGALAQIVKRSVEVKASLLSEDGKTHVSHTLKKGLASYESLGKEVATAMLNDGGKELVEQLKFGEKELTVGHEAPEKTAAPAPKPISIKKDTPKVATEAPVQEAEPTAAVTPELKPISIKKATPEVAAEAPVQEAEPTAVVTPELKPISIKKAEPNTEEAQEVEITSQEVNQETAAKASSSEPKVLIAKKPEAPSDPNNTMPKVLCLKKLTPPRIKSGTKLGLHLTGIEVIETLPDFDSVDVKQWLTAKNNWVFSSLNAVSAIGSVLKNMASIHKHVYCVGSRVANYFEGKVKGIQQVNSVADLTELARASGEEDYVWCHGTKSDLELVEDFGLLEMKLKPLSVYRTELSEPTIENLENYNVYAFFSPSGVDSFNANNYIPEGVTVAAIGDTTAEYIAEVYDEQENTQLENIIVPEKFEYEHLLAAIKAHVTENGTN